MTAVGPVYLKPESSKSIEDGVSELSNSATEKVPLRENGVATI